jgi:hypothetical protein
MTDEISPTAAYPLELVSDMLELLRSAKWAVYCAQMELPMTSTTGSWFGTANVFYEARRQRLHEDIDALNRLLEDTDQLLFSIGRMCHG